MMENNQEKNIRYFLKDIYDLYSHVTDFIFTTFNFEPDFFEEHLVTFLMGSDKKISTIGELNATNAWISEHGMCVYFDKGALISGSSCVTLPVYPKHVETGVFHPKVVVIHGTLKNNKIATYLVVSSCNLTVSGYGRNQEAFSCIQVTSEVVAKSLLSFLNTISDNDNLRHKFVKDYLRASNFTKKKNVEFFWNYGKQGESLVDRLSRMPKGNLTVVSPFYDEEGPEGLLKRISNIDKTTIIPAVDGENYNIYYKHYDNLKNAGVVFANLAGDGTNKRFSHAKIITKGEYIIVGSYNFTTAALDRLNAEAALIIDKGEPMRFSTIPIDENKFLEEEDKLVNRDTLGEETGSVFVSITIDWKLDKIIIYADISDQSSFYYVKIDGMKDSPEWKLNHCDENKCMKISINDSITRGLLRHKQFSVYRDNIICFKGLFNEINWIGVRPEIGCESLDETLAEWYMISNAKTNGSAYELRCITEEDVDTEKIIGGGSDSSADIFDNYYMVSKALGYLLQQVEINSTGIKEVNTSKRDCPRRREWIRRVDKARNSLYGILYSWPGSVSQMLEFLEKSEQEDGFDPVYGWLICKYLRRALKMVPRKIDELPIFEERYKVVKKGLKKLEDRIFLRIKKECNPDYYAWIEKELFRKEV